MTVHQDRVALVTGSSSGLGFAAARALVELGARVALNRRGGKKLAIQVAQQTGQDPDEILKAQGKELPIGPMADPSEIGEVIAFLCSPSASYVTGQAIAVEGDYLEGLA